MKTELFKGTDAPASKQFQKDVATLVRTRADVLKKLAEFMVLAHEDDFDPTGGCDFTKAREFLANKKKTPEDIEAMVRISGYLFNELTSPKNRYDVSDIAGDIAEVMDLSGQNAEKLLAFLATMCEKASVYIAKKLERATEEMGVPSFAGIGTVVDLRAIIPNYRRFRDYTAGNPYDPTISHFVPRGTISIVLSQYKEQRVVFQVTEEELGLLLDNLAALSADLAEVRRQAGHLLLPGMTKKKAPVLQAPHRRRR